MLMETTVILAAVGAVFAFLLFLSPTFAFQCRNIALHLYMLIASFVVVPLMIPKGRNEENLQWCCRGMIPGRWIFGLKRKIINAENMIRDKPCVIVSNHQCALDLFGMADLFPPKATYLAKKEFLYYGPLGLCFWLSGAVFIDRNAKDGRNVMQKCAEEVLQRNLKVWIFPEGTRNIKGGMMPFRKGAFNLAVCGQIPVVPVVYKSYSDIYNPQKNLFTRGTYCVEVLPPIETGGLKDEDVSKLCEAVRYTMLDAYNRLSGTAFT